MEAVVLAAVVLAAVVLETGGDGAGGGGAGGACGGGAAPVAVIAALFAMTLKLLLTKNLTSYCPAAVGTTR